MKKFENLGRKLSKEEQKKINGGVGDDCLASFSPCCKAENCMPCCGLYICILVGGEQGSMRCSI